MPDFADNFAWDAAAGPDAAVPAVSGAPVGNNWDFRARPESAEPDGNHPWVYERLGDHTIIRPSVRRTPENGGGADTLIFRTTPVPVISGQATTYDFRWVFDTSDYVEAIFRYTAEPGLLNDRLSVLVRKTEGSLVARNDNGEIILATWTRQHTDEFEISVFCSGERVIIYDSGFMGNEVHQAYDATVSHQIAHTGIGLGNGDATSFVLHDWAAGYTELDLVPGEISTRSEADCWFVDDVTAEPDVEQTENYAGILIPDGYTIVDGKAVTAGGDVLQGALYAEEAGRWRMFARRPGYAVQEITFFRGVPTLWDPWTRADPFGDKDGGLTLPAVSIFDEPGTGDLEWLSKDTDIDIVWEGDEPAGYPDGPFTWQGYVTSFDWTAEGLKVTLLGAMYQVDHYLAKPLYPARPIPYEVAIANQFRDRPSLRLQPLEIEFPAGWPIVYTPDPTLPAYRVPVGLRPGQPWTGMVTRQTGSFDQSLTSYIQSLLTSMYTETGRWTLDLLPDRRPVLRHRTFKTAPDAETVTIDAAAPGVELSMTEDWSQSLNAAYGQGVSLAGEAWSGQNVSTDGLSTSYEPLAAAPAVDPDDPAYDHTVMVREVMLQLQEGLSLAQAREAADSHLARFLEPGVTGSVTLQSDPQIGGVWVPRKTLKAGMTLHIPDVGGGGLTALATEVTTDRDGHTTSLTFDTKFRDALTVDEVRLRGRDSLAVTRSLIGGQYNPPIPDQLVPWNYAEGSGFIPSDYDGVHSCVPLFEGMPTDTQFPWTEITTQRPPSDPQWANCYIPVGVASTNADDNWAQNVTGTDATGAPILRAFSIRAAQVASIRLLQIAAYDANGYVMRVPFHVSFYAMDNVSVLSMPQLTAADAIDYPPYVEGQRYPFFPTAFERFRADGSQTQTEVNQAVSSAGLIRGFGTAYAKAGMWPNELDGDVPTGLLVDEGQWEIDTTRFDANFNPYQVRQGSARTGHIYVMIYCDAHTEPVYFMGRMFRQEPGATV